jgi:iron complex transport system substrate-binding protein
MFRGVSRQILSAVAVFALCGVAQAADAGRIVSVGGAVTEILYGLGADKNIVAVDTTSLYPPRAQAEKASVGYMRALSAEGVLGLRPSLILATEGSGPRETMSVLQAAKVPLTVVPDRHTGDGIIEKVRIIAKAVDAEARGKCIVNVVKKDLDSLGTLRAGIKAPKRVMFVLSLVNGRAMVSGGNTAADGVIKMTGAVNAVSDYDGYKPMSDEAVVATNPDVILAMAHGGPNHVEAAELFALPAFSATSAAKNNRFIAIDGLSLLFFGPRTARAARDLSIAIHPELASATPAQGASPYDACQE